MQSLTLSEVIKTPEISNYSNKCVLVRILIGGLPWRHAWLLIGLTDRHEYSPLNLTACVCMNIGIEKQKFLPIGRFPYFTYIHTLQSLWAKRSILISWKISRAGTPRKLNVVQLSSVSAHKSRQKTLRLDNYSKSWNMFAPPRDRNGKRP